MNANATEITNLFWHCQVGARLLDEFPANTATKGHVLRAVRMATLCAAGKNGVQYASEDARTLKDSRKKHWEKCGLVKEHIVPVSLICAQVTNALQSTRDTSQVARTLMLSDQDRQGLTAEVVGLFQQHPRAWEVARIVREWTHLAWITEKENQRFDEKDRHGGISIRKCMPTGWTKEHGIFARYDACNIVLSII